MLETRTNPRLADLWEHAKASDMSEPQRLLYRSNLLGSDKRITNYGGGNTSAKVMEKDPLTGEPVEVLWVKGSGGDVGTIKLDGFATLYQSKLEGLKKLYRGVEHEDEMVGYLPHCTFNLNARAASIDTPLHAFVPRKHVDHMHPDAIIAIAAAKNSKELTARDLRRRDRLAAVEAAWASSSACGWRNSAATTRKRPASCWKATACSPGATRPSESYETTIRIINRAIEWFEGETAGKAVFGGEVRKTLPAAERRAIAARLMPAIRGMISAGERKVGHFDDQPAVLEFVGSKELDKLAALGTSCPDHFLRTKIRPLVVDFDPANPDVDKTLAGLGAAIEEYRKGYAAYYERCKHADSPAMRDPNAVVYLVPGVGMITFAKDKATARISGEFYVNAINVMRGASTRLDLCRPARAGGFRHRILAARGGQAAAHAEAQAAGRQGRADHRRRRRHRQGDGRALPARRRLRGDWPTSTTRRSPRPTPSWPAATPPMPCAA